MEKEDKPLKEKFTKGINKINEIITSKNILFVLLIYVIGTIIVMFRNFNEGIPFSTHSIVSYGILTFYFTVFVGAMWMSKQAIELILQNEYQGNKFVKFIKKFGSCIIVLVLIAAIMFFWMNQLLYNTNIGVIITYTILLYCILPLVGFLKNCRKIKEFASIMGVIASFFVILNIPASIGGLKATQVKFYSYHNNIVYDYLYYGESDGNYIFKEGENKIILRSIDSGYVEYYKEEIKEQEKQMKYKVEIKETLSKIIEIEAENGEEAVRKIREQYEKQEIVLDSSDYVDTEFNVYRE